MPTETLPELPPAEPAPPRDVSTLPLIFGTVAVIALAVVMSIAALVAADDDDGSAASTGESVMVSESEFTIDPATVGVGGSLHVMNDGTVVHNLADRGHRPRHRRPRRRRQRDPGAGRPRRRLVHDVLHHPRPPRGGHGGDPRGHRRRRHRGRQPRRRSHGRHGLRGHDRRDARHHGAVPRRDRGDGQHRSSSRPR